MSGSGKLFERSTAREFVGSKMKLVDGRIEEGTLKFLSLLSQGILSLRLSKARNATAYRAGDRGWGGGSREEEFSASPKCQESDLRRGQEAGLTWAGYPGSAWWARCCAAGTRQAPSRHSGPD